MMIALKCHNVPCDFMPCHAMRCGVGASIQPLGLPWKLSSYCACHENQSEELDESVGQLPLSLSAPSYAVRYPCLMHRVYAEMKNGSSDVRSMICQISLCLCILTTWVVTNILPFCITQRHHQYDKKIMSFHSTWSHKQQSLTINCSTISNQPYLSTVL